MISIAARSGATKASSKMMIHRSCRVVIGNNHQSRLLIPRRNFSNKSTPSSSSHSSSAIEQVEAANNKSSSLSESSSSPTAAEAALSKLTNLATQATQLAKTKATDTVTNASHTIRSSLHNTKVNAKIKSEQYAWEAHRSITKVKNEMETQLKNKADDTKEKMKQSVEEVTVSTKERMKDEFSKRMEQFKIPPLFGGSHNNGASISGGSAQTCTKSASITAQQAESTLKDVIPNNNNQRIPPYQSKLSSLLPHKPTLSSLLPNQQTLSKATTETLSKLTNSQLSTQLQTTLHKAFKWLWWWGLAAVGVYGISTTLTKEGVKVLKDLIVVGGEGGADDRGKSFTSLSSVSKGGAKQDDAIAVVVESDYVNGGFEVISDDDTNSNNGGECENEQSSSSWLSSWRRGWK